MSGAVYADLTALAGDLAAASGINITQAAQQVIQNSAQEVQSAAQAAAPVKTGALRDSISISYPEPLTAIIGPKVEYGVYQEYGTGSRGEFPGSPYEIRPKKPGGYLVWKSRNGRVFARKVVHPGVRGKAYMRKGFTRAFGDRMVDQLLKAGLAAITKGPNAR